MAENAEGIDVCRIAGTAQVTEEDDGKLGQGSHERGRDGSHCWVVTPAAFTPTAGTTS